MHAHTHQPMTNREFKSTLVFCNTVKSCRAAEFGLREVDVPTLSYHGEVPSDERTSNLERFRAGEVEYLVRMHSTFLCSLPVLERFVFLVLQ